MPGSIGWQGLVVILIILLLVFGSAVAMGLPIVTAVLGLLCGLLAGLVPAGVFTLVPTFLRGLPYFQT